METDGDTLESLRAQLEDTRRAQAGQDRKNGEYQARIKDLEGQLEKYRSYGGGEDAVLSRLDRIQEAYRQKERALEIRYHLRERCMETGLDPILFDGMPFDDETQVDATISRWADHQDAMVDAAVNKRLTSVDKPRAGGGDPLAPSRYRSTVAGIVEAEARTAASRIPI